MSEFTFVVMQLRLVQCNSAQGKDRDVFYESWHEDAQTIRKELEGDIAEFSKRQKS